MKRTLLEDIERMHHIKDYMTLIPKTIERDYDDMTDMRNHPTKKIKYRGFTIEKDWLGMYSTNVGGDSYMTNKEWKIMKFIDEKIDENPELEDSGEE